MTPEAELPTAHTETCSYVQAKPFPWEVKPGAETEVVLILVMLIVCVLALLDSPKKRR